MRPQARVRRIVTSVAVVGTMAGMLMVASAPAARATATPAAAASIPPGSGCQLNSPSGAVQHVIQIQFDNTHFTRDNPNVPSDLEQMPNLLNFMEGNGVLLSNHHTPLISHTATDVLTTETGVYPDRHGVAVSNSFRVFDPANPSGSDSTSSFGYWTDPARPPVDSAPLMVDQGGKIAPAPWVPYTRAGCNVGEVATANAEIESVNADIPVIFGKSSPEYAQLQSDPNPYKDQENADYQGIAIHCGASSAVCANPPAGTRAAPDVLPSEPGGYNGFQALFGHKYVAPVISPSGPLKDLNGQIITDPYTNTPGFPGFDISSAAALSYVAGMQEHGIPVTYAYIRDAHQNYIKDQAAGPGDPAYEANLRQEDRDFGKFFARLARDGITPANTLFVVTADEGDHFAGMQLSGCNGVTTPCRYGTGQIGELNTNIQGLLATEKNDTTPFQLHADDAPTFYVAGNPGRTSEPVRQLERDVAGLTAPDPYLNKANAPITQQLADRVEMDILHMQTADPARNPTFTAFLNPDYFAYTGGPTCPTPPPPGQSATSNPCVTINPQYAWNHGDVQPDITTTWLGMVGPGIGARGVDAKTWSDHTDVRPTTLALLGLRDDYQSDGRVLREVMGTGAVPEAVKDSPTFLQLATMYKQLNAPVGQFARNTLTISTKAMASGTSSDDGAYNAREQSLESLGSIRDNVAAQMKALLGGAEFDSEPFSPYQSKTLLVQGRLLLDLARSWARS